MASLTLHYESRHQIRDREVTATPKMNNSSSNKKHTVKERKNSRKSKNDSNSNNYGDFMNARLLLASSPDRMKRLNLRSTRFLKTNYFPFFPLIHLNLIYKSIWACFVWQIINVEQNAFFKFTL